MKKIKQLSLKMMRICSLLIKAWEKMRHHRMLKLMKCSLKANSKLDM